MSGPERPGVEVPPAELARVSGAADLCARDLDGIGRRFVADAEAGRDAAPESTTSQLVATATEWFASRLGSHSRAVGDIASGLRSDQAQFQAVDQATAGRIAAALEPGRPPR